MLDTGARASEVLRLDVDNFDMAKRRVSFPKKATKTKKARTQFLSPVTVRELFWVLRRRESGPAFLSTQRQGKRLDYNAIQARLSDLSADAHLPERILSHGLRRLFGQTIADNVEWRYAAALLGHSGATIMGVTARYVRTDLEKLAEIHAKYSPVLSLKYPGPLETYGEWRERNKESSARGAAIIDAARAADPDGYDARREAARHRPRKKG